MLSFKHLFEGKSVHFMDIDDTTFHTSGENGPKIKVKDKKTGEITHSLSSSEFNTHKLEPHHEYDFSDFKDAKVFTKSKPIRPILAKIKAIQKNGGRVEFNTARSDLNDKDEVLGHFKKHGIDMDKSHIHRTGNDKSDRPIGEKKNDVVRKYLTKNPETKHVHLYDDATSNLDEFHKLKGEYPDVKFTAHHVQPNGRAKVYHPQEK